MKIFKLSSAQKRFMQSAAVCVIILLTNYNVSVPIYPQSGENIWNVAAGIATTVDRLASSCDFSSTFTMINAINTQLLAISSKLDLLQGCSPTIIKNQTTIQTGGYYALCANLAIASGNGITINADDVTINLDGYSIVNSGSAQNGIVINPGKARCHIYTGLISGMLQNGILHQGTRSTIQDCDLVSNTTGVGLLNADSNLIYNARAQGSTYAGISLVNSSKNYVSECKVLGTLAASTSAYGYISSGGMCNTFDDCNCNSIVTQATGATAVAAGIALTNNETKSLIFHPEITAIQSPTAGNAMAYGIKLQESFDGSVTTTFADQTAGVTSANSLNWAPSGKYLAQGGDESGNKIKVFSFDGFALQFLTSAAYGATVNSVDWSNDGNYIAVGGVTSGGIQVAAYQFDGVSLALTTSVAPGAQVNSVQWSPDSKYVAVGGVAGTDGNQVRVYRSNGARWSQVAGVVHGATVNSVCWSFDGAYLAIGGVSGTGSFDTRVYAFNGSSLTLLDSKSHGATVNSVSWTPNGRYLLVGGGTQIRVYSFNGSVLTSITTATPGGTVNSVDWNQSGSHLVEAGTVSGGFDTRTYSFDGATLTLASSLANNATAYSASWALSGLYLAVGTAPTTGIDIRLFKSVITGVTQCVVRDAGINCVSGSYGTGVGISVSTLNNTVLSSQAVESDRPFLFVDNAFEGGLFGTPTLIQNISEPPRY